MIGSWEIEHLDNPGLFHDMAVAYLDISIVATRQMVYGALFLRFSHTRVVLSMAYHAIELFLKGAILRATAGKKRGGHVLQELHEEYRTLYPDEAFQFEVPFSVGYIGFTPQQIAELREKEPPQDQMYRYHTDRDGEQWEGVHSFDANSFLQTLESLRKTFMDLGRVIHQNLDNGQQEAQGPARTRALAPALCSSKYMGVGMDLRNLQLWIKENCPQIYGMLNAKAKKQLPPGITEYLGSGSLADIEAGQEQFSLIERTLTTLVSKCGWESVAGNYRRDLSAVNSVNQVAELFCEIALCASVGESSQNLKLRPPTGKGTHSDCLITVNGLDIYGEAKRYEDPWPHIEKIGNKSNDRTFYARSISRTGSGQNPSNAARPRSMDLRSKLRGVHRQFPDGTVNILFIFHPSLGETLKYITQALFGDSNFYQTDSVYRLEKEGLFSIDQWKNISACCLARVNSEAKVVFPVVWKNPLALAALPEGILNLNA